MNQLETIISHAVENARGRLELSHRWLAMRGAVARADLLAALIDWVASARGDLRGGVTLALEMRIAPALDALGNEVAEHIESELTRGKELFLRDVCAGLSRIPAYAASVSRDDDAHDRARNRVVVGSTVGAAVREAARRASARLVSGVKSAALRDGNSLDVLASAVALVSQSVGEMSRAHRATLEAHWHASRGEAVMETATALRVGVERMSADRSTAEG